MSTDQNKALYRRFIQEVFNEGHLEVVDELLSASYVDHDTPPGMPRGAEGLKRIVSMFRSAFPDLKITIEDLIAEGDKICARTTMRGTHLGALFGIAPTGKTVAVSGLIMDRFAGGRLAESWVRNDVMGLMNQLGAGAASH
jgi:predicted ester cyclase